MVGENLVLLIAERLREGADAMPLRIAVDEEDGALLGFGLAKADDANGATFGWDEAIEAAGEDGSEARVGGAQVLGVGNRGRAECCNTNNQD